MKIIVNGAISSADSPSLYHNDRGLLLGDGLFETMRYDNNKIEFFKEHYLRLSQSANTLDIDFPYTQDKLASMCYDLIKENNLDNKTAALRVTLTRGPSQRGIAIPEEKFSTLIITASQYACKDQLISAYITDIKRNEYSILTKLKTINYLESILARQQALQHNRCEGIMLNTQGAITETSVGNIFLIADNVVLTPKLSDGVLPGIVRSKIIEMMRANHIAYKEKTIYPEALFAASEVFHTNSLLLIQKINFINGTEIDATDEPITVDLLKSLFRKSRAQM